MPDYPSWAYAGYLLKVPYDSPWPAAEHNAGVRVMHPRFGTGTVRGVEHKPLVYNILWDTGRVSLTARELVQVIATR